MTFGRIAHRSRHHGLSRTLSVVAASVLLIVIAYGIAKPPEWKLVSSSEIVLAAQLSTTSTSGSGGDMALSGPPVSQTRFVMTGPPLPTGQVDAARECAPEAGVTDACIFN
jgi:hypothetical protein